MVLYSPLYCILCFAVQVCFHTMWAGWAEGIAARLSAAAGTDLASPFYRLMGYNPDTRRVLLGRMAEVTNLSCTQV